MSFKIQFGELIPNLKLYGEKADYRVLNERDARAAAGIMFILGSIAFALAFLLKNFTLIRIFVIMFTIEFGTRVLINPNYAPFYSLGKLLVSNQEPEWSGAIQKKFAWSLGFGLAGIMLLVMFIFNLKGIVPLTICVTCLTLLWLETSLGVCVGCKMYNGMINLGWIKKPKIKPACPGGVCKLK
ncbi:DUF4395 domain-containing protein [archaeon]|nr:DUF4395 domain-containing protein [archaeon]MBT6868912.1 DUF4395 domain-containing protein [archaeon]MBT7192867.1 DUF4395 domain-containing protein [archaeon]MBT7380833.1 DUF4395 domain-containing protein [archaeon]MBT7507588.1 DUF4395 domain-containing protein [archaeon]